MTVKENMKYLTLRKAWVFTFILWVSGLLAGLAVGYILSSTLPIVLFLALALLISALLKAKAYKIRHLIVQKELNEMSKNIFLFSTGAEIIFSIALIGVFIGAFIH